MHETTPKTLIGKHNMDVFEAVNSRFSCRWFLDKPVDPGLVRELITRAARAASGGNLQPWQVYALTGSALGELKRQVADYVAAHDPRKTEAEYLVYPKTMWDPYKARREHHGVQLYGALGIPQDDAEQRFQQHKRNYQFFNAPVALFIAIDRKLGPGQWADLGGYIHTLMFLARGYGLDTCSQEILGALAPSRPAVCEHAAGANVVLRGLDRLRRSQSRSEQFPFAPRSAGRFLLVSGL